MISIALLVLFGVQNAAACCCTLYEHCNYEGWDICVDHNKASVGSKNDKISSIKVGEGCTCTMYEHYNYGGKSFKRTTELSCMTGITMHKGGLFGIGKRSWNDQISSVKVETKPINCGVSGWTNVGTCDKATGLQAQSRTVTKKALHGGTCPSLVQQTKCRVDCEFNKFPEWKNSKCDKEKGIMQRATTVKHQPRNGGSSCDPNKMVQTEKCRVDCELNPFGNWGNCDSYTGKQTRKTTVRFREKNNGNKCPPDTEVQACRVDCKLKSWSNWICSKSTGIQTRKTEIDVWPKNGGTKCPNLEENQPCKVDCEMNPWGKWSECNKKDGKKTMSRTVKYAAQNGGTTCAEATKTENCPVDCMSQYGPFGQCSAQCGVGTKTALRVINQPSLNGGKACIPPTKTESCKLKECPVDCEFSYSKWSACTQSCGTGTQTATLKITKKAEHGGKACPPATKSQNCNTQMCPIDCKGEYTKWSACSRKCGGGMQTSKVVITQKPMHGGKACPISKTKPCNTQKCPCCAQLFQHCDYKGWKKVVCEPQQMSWIGKYYNDRVSSVKVDHGCMVYLYEHINYKGKYIQIKNNDSCLVDNGFNDKLSSAKSMPKSLAVVRMTAQEIAEQEFVESSETEFLSGQTAVLGAGAAGIIFAGAGFYLWRRHQPEDEEQQSLL